jgi:hypothetical protein
MYLGNKRLSQELDSGFVTNFLLHADEPRDKYDQYLSYGTGSSDPFSNPRNFFADSNVEDRKFYRAVKKYLSRAK